MSTELPRGTVTFFFSDIEGSTDLLRRVGDDAFAAIRADHHRLLRSAFATQGGREIDTAGDGFFVAFDSARSAVTAAVDAQRALAAFTWPADVEVRVRMGLHTAEPYLHEDGYIGVGVTRASRICNAARGGQVLISNATAGIIEDAELPGLELVDLGEHRLKGLARTQRLFQVSAPGLRTRFGPPRTPDTEALAPGAGTFLASDLAGWRHVIKGLGDEASAALAAEYQGTVGALVEANRGIVLERVADTVVAVFRNASEAVDAAAAIRDALYEFAWPPDFDIAPAIVLHSGRWSGDPRRPEASTALYRLTRLLNVVAPRQVLVSQTTAGLLEGDRHTAALRSLGEWSIPDFDQPVPIYELIEAR